MTGNHLTGVKCQRVSACCRFFRVKEQQWVPSRCKSFGENHLRGGRFPVRNAGGFHGSWLVPFLGLPLLFLLSGCVGGSTDQSGGTGTDSLSTLPSAIDTTYHADTSALADTLQSSAPLCSCNGSTNPVFTIYEGQTPKVLTHLGDDPEFGDSHVLDGAGFYKKLAGSAKKNVNDKRFLDGIFEAMGYANGFADAKPGMFSEVVLPVGTVGNMGSGKEHKTLYAQLPDDERDRKAFRIKSANGCDIHFMKSCGNHFFFCPDPVAAPAAVCACKDPDNPVFYIPEGQEPKVLTHLGTNPEFGDSHGLDGAGFYKKLAGKAKQNSNDKRFLDGIFKAMGYENGFADADPGMFSDVVLPAGTVGNMGSGKEHKTIYAQLPDNERDRQAFHIESANGCDLHFMKSCGNHFFFCQDPASAPAAVCACKDPDNPVFYIPEGQDPKVLTHLGTNPEFGDWHGLDGAGFYKKLAGKAKQNSNDKRFLDGIFQAMGYENGFADADPGMFSDVVLPAGTVGNMGSGKEHKTLYAQLPDNERDRQAFRIESANGCDLHFMKSCGNHFFFCPN